jgi:hypothetical protein
MVVRNINNKKILRRSVHACVVFGTILAMYFVATQLPFWLPEEYGRQWHMIASAEGDPGAGASGVINVFIYPHTVDPATTYSANISLGWYAQYDTLNHTLTGDVPYDTAFDIVVKCRANQTHAYNSTSHVWELDWIRANATCSDLSFTSENLSMNEQNISGTDAVDFIWVHYYLQDADGGAGTGFTISHGVSVNVTYFKFEAYF